jgi:hypothetical protein
MIVIDVIRESVSFIAGITWLGRLVIFLAIAVPFALGVAVGLLV